MKFHIFSLFFIFVSTWSVPLEKSQKNGTSIDRKIVKEIIAYSFHSREITQDIEDCLSEVLNVPEGFSVKIGEAYIMPYIYALSKRDYSILDLASRYADHCVAMENSPGILNYFSPDELFCMKVFLLEVRPNSEYLKGFNASDALTSSCESKEIFYYQIKEWIKMQLEDIKFEKCNPDSVAADDIEIYLTSNKNDIVVEYDEIDYEITNMEELIEIVHEIKKRYKIILKRILSCILSEFDE